MASKEDKEAALNAKIAAIRAANKATEKRHQEIVADRLLAEKTKSSITLKEDETKEDNGGPVDGTPDRFKSPFPDKGQLILKYVPFWCLQIDQKTNEIFVRISALASKKEVKSKK